MARIVTLTMLLLVLAAGCSTSKSPPSANQPEPRNPPSSTTVNSSVPQLLQAYEQLSTAMVQMDDGVADSQAPLIIPPHPAMTRSQTLKFIEKTLHDQAGIVATHPKPDLTLFKLKKHHP